MAVIMLIIGLLDNIIVIIIGTDCFKFKYLNNFYTIILFVTKETNTFITLVKVNLYVKLCMPIYPNTYLHVFNVDSCAL